MFMKCSDRHAQEVPISVLMGGQNALSSMS